MASRMTPKTLRITLIPEFPKKRSMRLEDLRTTYTTRILITMATIILATSNSARKARREVKVPAPAMSGKAMGTIEAVSGDSSL